MPSLETSIPSYLNIVLMVGYGAGLNPVTCGHHEFGLAGIDLNGSGTTIFFKFVHVHCFL